MVEHLSLFLVVAVRLFAECLTLSYDGCVVRHSAFMVSGNGRHCLAITVSPCIKDLIRYCWTVNSVQRVALVFPSRRNHLRRPFQSDQ